jgi:hypothetical protein
MPDVQTFVLRLWINAPADDPDDGLRGFLDEVSTGRSFFFRGPGELLALLPATGGAAPGASGAIPMRGIDMPEFRLEARSAGPNVTNHERREA